MAPSFVWYDTPSEKAFCPMERTKHSSLNTHAAAPPKGRRHPTSAPSMHLSVLTTRVAFPSEKAVLTSAAQHRTDAESRAPHVHPSRAAL